MDLMEGDGVLGDEAMDPGIVGSDMIILVAMIARWEVGRDILMKGLMDDTWAGHQVGIKELHLIGILVTVALVMLSSLGALRGKE